MTCRFRPTRVLLVISSMLCLAAPNRAEPVITEFMAANTKTLADADGRFSDWVELHNPDAAAVNLAGWFLTDTAGNKTKWQFPAVTIPAGGYLVVFASDKNRRDPAKELHTNFSLDADGEYLALIKPDGLTATSEFAPKFPVQKDDISYGTTQPTVAGENPRTGYFRTPTPGARNGSATSLLLFERVTFSRPSGPFTGTITVAMTGAASGQRIRYVVAPPAATGANVPEPTAAATEYTGPITISTSSVVRAAVFAADNLAHGFATTGHYVRLANSGANRLDTFASQLPLLVIDTHGTGSLVKDGIERPAWLYTWNRPATGNTTLGSDPTAISSIATNVRGSSSADFPKKSYAVSLNDGLDNSNSRELFGLTAFDSWDLVGPWFYDRTYLHNSFMYALSNRIGRWAARTQLVEVFFNANGGDLDYSDYAGVYVFTESLKVDKDRVAITSIEPEDVTPPEITGGYFVKFDLPSPDEFSFQTKRDYPGAPLAVIVASPKAAALPKAQRDYIQNYVQGYEDAAFNDYAGGFRQRTYLDYIDRPAWIDHHILNVLAMNPDAFARSAYMMKDRGARLAAGPVWDFDRTLNGGDVRSLRPDRWNADNTTGATEFWVYGWWGALARDPEFMQAWIDRWQKLRRDEFSTASLSGLVDSLAAQIGPAAAARDTARWPDNASRFSGGWQGEIDNLKTWLAQRTAWIDSQFTALPTVTNSAGVLTVTPAPGTQLAYTTDGTDPRAFGGGLSRTAKLSAAPVSLANTLNLQARSYRASFDLTVVPGSPWSSVVDNPGRLINLSILTELAAGESFTMGFVVGGGGTSGSKALLARAAGPSLTQLGVNNAHADPKLEFFTGATKITENDNWNGATSISNVFAQVGAFAYLSASSKDAAVFDPTVALGNNSVVVAGTGSASGTVIAELYDATPAAAVGATTPRLVNVSVLKQLGSGLTSGFVIGSGSARNVLIRAIGPTLGTAFGLKGVVNDPKLTLFRADSAKIAENDDWDGAPVLSAAFAAVGAFALPRDSRDAALLATLAPGSYTVQVTGAKSATGTALVEIYEAP